MASMNTFAWSGVLIAATSLAVGWLIYGTNRTNPVHQRWALFCACVVLYGLGVVGVGLARTPEDARLAWRLGYVGVTFIPGLFYWFVATFLGMPRRGLLAVMAGLTALFSLANTTPLLIPRVHLMFGHIYYLGPPSPLYLGFFAFFFIVVILSHAELLWAATHRTDPQQRVQIRWLLTSMALGFGGGLTCFAPVFKIPLYPYGNFAVAVYPAFISYAIVKYQLLDVRLVITRTGAFLGTYLIVLGGPIALSMLGQGWLEAHVGRYWWALPLGLSTVLASTGPLLYARLWAQARAGLMRELASKEAALVKAQSEAAVDTLTGVLVRRSFLERTDVALLRAKQLKRPCTLLMVDLDRFKEQNDRYGHLAGDAVLKEVAARLQQTIRPQDLLGRYGGEELILLLIGTAPEDALPIAERLRTVVAGAPIQSDHLALSQTLSIGLAGFPDDGQDVQRLIAKADQALYAAKRSGRNRVVRL